MQKINNKMCGSGEAIVGYIYNELSSTERLAFEDHLLECTSCTDEFAAIADSRYSVYEWQKLEFEPMETPLFVIPYAEPSLSWFDSIKAVFATGPRLAAAGSFALLIAAFGFAAILFSTNSPDVVSIDSIQVTDTLSAPVAPTVESASVEVSPSIENAAVANDDEAKPEVAVVTKAPKTKPKRNPSTARRNTVRPPVVESETQAKAPRLNDFEEVTDESLRLTDLVADIDTRD